MGSDIPKLSLCMVGTLMSLCSALFVILNAAIPVTVRCCDVLDRNNDLTNLFTIMCDKTLKTAEIKAH